MTHKANPKQHNNPPNRVPNVLYDPDLEPSLSDSSLSNSSDSSDDEYYKQRRQAKKEKNKRRSKTCFDDPIKKCANLTAKIPTSTYK